MNQWVTEMLRQKEENEKLLKRIEKDLRHVPEGDLRIALQRGRPRFYHTRLPDGGPEQYLSSAQSFLRDALAQKKYLLSARQAVEEEQQVIEWVLKREPSSLLDVYTSLPKELQELVEPYVLTDEQYARQWLSEVSQNASGEDFKSRIEVIVDGFYRTHEAPHVYEPSLYLEGYGPVRPDFAVLNVRTRQMYYHEHFGMMDDMDYRVRNLEKLRAYHNNGFYEGINLIVTMESDGGMVDYKEIENLIVTYCK